MILELRSKQQLLQKEIIRVIKEIKDETEIKTNEILMDQGVIDSLRKFERES